MEEAGVDFDGELAGSCGDFDLIDEATSHQAKKRSWARGVGAVFVAARRGEVNLIRDGPGAGVCRNLQ